MLAPFIVRRLFISFFVLLGATFIVYMLVASAGDPRSALYESTDPGKANRIAAMTRNLSLDVPIIPRYFAWLGGALGCLIGKCDLGNTASGAPVSGGLSVAMGSTLRLVVFALVIAIVVGVSIGMITALRQYSGLDYSVTFLAFLFFSLPVFWIAVLMKQFLAIKFNDWLKAPSIPPWVIVVSALITGLIAAGVVGGDRRRRLAAFGGASVAVAVLMTYFAVTDWFAEPSIGPVAMIAMSAITAIAATALFAGFRSRVVLYSTLVTAVVGVICYFALDSILADPTTLLIVGLLVLALIVGAGIGAAMGGLYRSQAIKACMLTSFGCGGLIFASELLAALPAYSAKVNGVVVATIGATTPNFSGNFWETTLDQLGHLLLPTIAIVLISIAAYTRYTRSSMLEVMNADYIRTARAKGLTERTVVVRHGFRNALIPITTIVALDVGGLIGGAIITETVFGWSGMGKYFNDALKIPDPNAVMGFFLVTGTAIVLFNMVADITYGFLDPRIRLS
jgi:peptide/nickel transport system permease protein